MFSSPSSLSPRTRYWLGFWCGPLVTWLCLAVATAAIVFVFPLLPQGLRLPSSWAFGYALLFVVLFFTCAAFSGFAAAFFWSNFRRGGKGQDKILVGSIMLTHFPVICLVAVVTFNLVATLIIAPFAFLIFLWIYDAGLEYGLKFWNSNRARQWFGDFSELP